MTMFAVLLWSLFFGPLTENDVMRRPEVLRMRMALLKSGMKEGEAKLALGICQHQPTLEIATNRYHSYSGQFNLVSHYDLGWQQTLKLVVQDEDKALVSATLYGPGSKVIASFPPGQDAALPKIIWTCPEAATGTPRSR
jgi:hypothetical protein